MDLKEKILQVLNENTDDINNASGISIDDYTKVVDEMNDLFVLFGVGKPLKDKEAISFEDWKDDNFRYISNTMYERIKTIYFKDELLKIYENETANL